MKSVMIAILACMFFLLRPYQLQNSGMLYQGDDYNYFAHASSIAFGEFPSYSKEYIAFGKDKPVHHSIGSGILASPFVFLFSSVDRVLGSDIVQKRTKENIAQSWSAFGFVFASCFYFCLACFLLYKGAVLYVPHYSAFYAVLLMVLMQGMPLFAFRRPVFSHSFEFFMQSLLVFILMSRGKKDLSVKSQYCLMFFIFLSALLIFLIRNNNITAALMWLVIFGFYGKTDKSKNFLMHVASIFMILIGSALIFVKLILYPYFLKTSPVDAEMVSGFFHVMHISHYINRVFYILGALDWGLLYTAPFIFLGLWFMFTKNIPLKRHLILACFAVMSNLYIILRVAGHGSWYGYRIFLPSLLPVLILPFACLLESLRGDNKKQGLIFLFVLSFVPAVSMAAFEGNATNLTLQMVEGHAGWNNFMYQVEVWKTLFFSPIQFLIVIFKGGALYLVYLLANAFGLSGSLPGIVAEKYPYFSCAVLVRVMFLYCIPILMYLFFNTYSRKTASK